MAAIKTYYNECGDVLTVSSTFGIDGELSFIVNLQENDDNGVVESLMQFLSIETLMRFIIKNEFYESKVVHFNNWLDDLDLDLPF